MGGGISTSYNFELIRGISIGILPLFFLALRGFLQIG